VRGRTSSSSGVKHGALAASPAVRPCRALPKWRAGEGAMSTLFIVSAAALSAMAGPLRWGRGLSLPYEHEDRGADVCNQEKADERGGERKTEFERTVRLHRRCGCGTLSWSPPLCRNVGFPPNPAGTGCPPGFSVKVRGHTRLLSGTGARGWRAIIFRCRRSLAKPPGLSITPSWSEASSTCSLMLWFRGMGYCNSIG
jgi:hypothetical protein